MLKKILTSFIMLTGLAVNAQPTGNWLATLQRPDGEKIVFNFTIKKDGSRTVLYVINAAEKIKVDNIRFTADSVFISMPVFESVIKAAIKNNAWQGTWTKGGTSTEQVMAFRAAPSTKRFSATAGNALFNVSGRWAVRFKGDTSAAYPSVAEFKQIGNQLTGTILTPTGDYRYLQGIVTGNQLKLSTFDGGHAFLFTATVGNNKTISNGQFYSGNSFKESWHAVKNPKAKVNTAASSMAMRPGETKLNFTFPDLNGVPVSINDQRFKNKVVVVQIMGSWCPNCMDETIFLSNYYKANKQRGVEVIALAYENSTDFDRSVKSVKKFQQRFDVEYPMLITGVSVSDSLRTEKTLPQITPIKFFPSSIIIDKKGIVRKFDTEFVGPGTGAYYEAYVKAFNVFMEKLLEEDD